MDEVTFNIAEAPFELVSRLQHELGVGPLAAQALVRRGLGEVDAARRFLAADETHDASLFEGIDEACELIEGHVRAGSPILVHGDYDADGVCSTAILIEVLRELGSDPTWFIPGRREDGYGLSLETVERAADGGIGLLATADCAITAVEEVAQARKLGLDVVVTDHHRPRSDGELPDAPIVHPTVSGYPFPELCAAGVVHKLAGRLRERAGIAAPARPDLDLVAIATIADCVDLSGENRRLVKEGLEALATTRRPGLRALMRVSQADPSGVDEQTVGFRLAPRLNAAGRVQRADAAVELLLAGDEEAADRCAHELDRLNSDRRHIETRIRFEAESQISAAGPQPGYVLASTEWHPGVIGITASRLSERHGRPVILIAIDGETGTGSGRSIPGFDLLEAIDASAAPLSRHGGHAAAAGCTVDAARIDEFRALFTDVCRQRLGDDPPKRSIDVDVVASPGSMTIENAASLSVLGPFGEGNEAPLLMLPGVVAEKARAMGEGRHIRFTVATGRQRAGAVAFGTPSLPAFAADPVDLACRLEINRWKGREEPRVLAEAMAPASLPPAAVIGEPDDEATALIEAIERAGSASAPASPVEAGRKVIDRREEDGLSVASSLAAGRESVVALVRDAHRMRRRTSGFNLGADLASWAAARREPSLLERYTHVVVLDPPLEASDMTLLAAGRAHQFSHLAWGDAELRSILDELEREQDLRSAMVEVYRAASERPAVHALEVLSLAGGERASELSALIAAVFIELGIAEVTGDGLFILREGAKADLESSELRRHHLAKVREQLQWLSTQQSRAA